MDSLKWHTSKFLIAGALVLAFAMFSAGAAANNMVADFSGTTKSDGYPQGWNSMLSGSTVGETVFFEVDPETNEVMLKIVHPGEGRYGVVSDRIEIEPGVDYMVMGEARSEDGNARARLFIEYLDQDGRRINPTREGRTASTEWEVVANMLTAPADAVWVRVFAYAEANRAGTTYYRNVQLMRY